MISRRQFLAGLMALPAAPLIAKAARLLPEPKAATPVLPVDLRPRLITLTNPSGPSPTWIERRIFSRDEIARVFQVPPHMIGDVISTCNAESTYAAAWNIE